MMAAEADLRKLLSMAGADPNRVNVISAYIQGAAKEGVEEQVLPTLKDKVSAAALPKIQPFILMGLGISLLALVFALKASKLTKAKALSGARNRRR
jgi:hypothetical protein